MNIRCFARSDAHSVVALWKRCELVVPWNDPFKDIERKLRQQPELFLVGEINGDIIASVMAGYDGHRGWINYLSVAPEHRGKHYAGELVGRIESMLSELGCPKLNLQVRSSNKAVVEFYQHLGYQIDEAISMGKRLIPDN